MKKITMARLDVDETKTSLFSHASGRDVSVNQALQFVIRPDDGVVCRVYAVFFIEQRMVIGDAGF